MTVTVSKPQLNLREELSALKKKSGIKGEELLRSNTVADVYTSINPMMFKNRVINGDFRIDQRKNGAGATYNSSNSYQYLTADRFFGVATGTGVLAFQQMNSFNTSASNYEANSAPPGFTNSLKVTVSTADSGNSYHMRQRIEGYTTADFGWGTAAAKPAVLSFWVKSSVTGKYSVNLFNYNHDYAYTANYTINTANTWEYKTIYVTPPTSAPATPFYRDTTCGIQLAWMFTNAGTTRDANTWSTAGGMTIAGDVNLAAISGATWYITGIQFEPGSVATPFEFRPYPVELGLCQRYFQNTFNYRLMGGSNGGGGGTCYAHGPLIVPMRTTPSCSVSGSVSVDWMGSGVYTSSNPGSPVGVSNVAIKYDILNLGASVTGYIGVMTSGNVSASAEL